MPIMVVVGRAEWLAKNISTCYGSHTFHLIFTLFGESYFLPSRSAY